MSKNASPINEDVVRQLAEILNDTGLTEIEYEKDDCRIRVARQITMQNVQAAIPSIATPALEPLASDHSTSDGVIADAPTDFSKHLGAIKSPMVGNAYLSAAPGDDPFIKLGDSVKAGDTILIIEAMKVMNQIKAPKDGVVTQIFIHDSDPVEFDQVLVIIE